MELPAITFQKDFLAHFENVIEKEWIITNGLGSYAATTIPGINTRKYHGLLVAALNPPGDRTVCLAKLDEDLLIGDTTYRLGSNEFHDIVFPDGYKHIEQFTLNPYPTYVYDLGSIEVKKTIFLHQLKNVTAIAYHITNHNNTPLKIRLYPLLTCRYYHNVIDRFRVPLNFTQESNLKDFQVMFMRPQATIMCRITDGVFIEGLNWVERLHYRDEATRGEADFDDLFQPGYFELQIPALSKKDFAITCAASLEGKTAAQILDSAGTTSQEIDHMLSAEVNNSTNLLRDFYGDHPQVPQSDWLNWILLAANSFIVQDKNSRKAIIAGYYWFEPWGRDTFISLPGLMLTTNRFAEAKDTLQNFMRYFKDGLIPNFVADKTGAPIYNTVDGTLWYVNAVLQYIKYTSDYDFIKTKLWENLKGIIEHHQKGTFFGIQLDSDGLLMHGPRLTWMDAVVEGDMITPRAGKAVEVQALWYNTLKIMENLADRFDETTSAKQYAAMAEQTCQSFNEKYWNSKYGCLYDVLEPNRVDVSIRPNQIFAVSLDYTMLNKETSRRIVDVVNREHVTPHGLRTLSIDDPKFMDKCAGNRRTRDAAYHNGTIWPWLLGPYITAYLKVNDYSSQARKQTLDTLILPLFRNDIYENSLGTINEIYDCKPPNIPRGCISQAWSIAEPLRAYIEDILQIKPSLIN
ncbi:amylo-alpha-1,6-glucosidase [Candidatus Bathycorpusculum sp.]|uniref:amylo-alpha-1,6-glucosidase n=1 Tax=Candidatus Bathycorpusculum sp. TaxID=2994959 RepID=UPI00281CC912|nr:glycogen debranching enzyme N-terminal domain-containing protein [Candidatus Termitimicrobium sp.]MCL2431334.1 glycogen debranching enzyme N-terminal domain-containing protein [Candidatus Termitimicrobium sp.]